MAQLVVSAAAAAVGYAIGGPTGAAYGWAIGSAIGASAFAKPQKNPGQPLMDLRVMGTEYGQPIPYIRGAAGVAGQVWWNSDRRPTTTTTTTGGKGGGGEVETTSTTYDIDMLIGVSDNEIVGIRRIWNNGKLIYTAASDATQESIDASEALTTWTRMTVYTGADDQLPDPTYEAAVGTANAPAYRGRGTVFIQGLQLGQSGIVPNLTFEVVADGTVSDINEPWTIRASAADNNWLAITWGNDLFVAVSTDGTGNRVMTSDDGITWTSRVSVDKQWTGITYGNGLFVAVAQGAAAAGVMTSPDGITWTGRVTPTGYDWHAVAYGNGLFVAVAYTGADQRVMTSPDGFTWTLRDTPTPARNTSPWSSQPRGKCC